MRWQPQILLLFGLVVLAPFLWVPTATAAPIVYRAPRPNAQFVNPRTTITLRLAEAIEPGALDDAYLHVVGSASGVHQGRIAIAADRRTIIFTPTTPFSHREWVQVIAQPGYRTARGVSITSGTYRFQIAPPPPAVAAAELDAIGPAPLTGLPQRTSAPASPQPRITRFRTLPADFPPITATVTTTDTQSGYYFLSTFDWGTPKQPYLLILDGAGQPVYYRRMTFGLAATDFKRQPNGLLTYYDRADRYYIALDATYTIVDTYRAGNGYNTDQHELQLLPNGHALLMIYDPQTVDMSSVVPGGNPAATVIGLVIQELDAQKQVVFEWRSWDHFQITDATAEDLTAASIDYAHGNAIERDTDGNILISSRHMDEITKIDRQTGQIIWRLGGKNNQFTFVNDPKPFVHQHDIRRLPNGNITLFDNQSDQTPPASRAVEYRLDEVQKTATRVWEYRPDPAVTSEAMGSVQRLPNGNTVIGWGSATAPLVTEVTPDGAKVAELETVAPLVSYRALRSPWRATPVTTPTLVLDTDGVTTTLAMSWNGATDVAAYRVYGRNATATQALVATLPKTGFETSLSLPLAELDGFCAVWVTPVDQDGQALRSSEEIVLGGQPCTRSVTYLPLVGSL
jgi:hypothetical protein